MFTLNCKGKLLVIDSAIVMGIINITPDSFYSGSRIDKNSGLISYARKMIDEGAAILDLGGQSTRPGSTLVSAEEEWERVIPAIETIHREFPDQLISVDTFYASVAEAAVNAGAHIINDVSAGAMDQKMIEVVAALGVPYVLMHMPGTPQTMAGTVYTDVALNVFDFLSFTVGNLMKKGIKDIIVDPGFGFGKNTEQNFELLSRLSFFKHLRLPLMVGLSRKATIYKTLNITPVQALNGSTVMHTIALLNGANILRVHDVKEAVEAIQLCKAYQNKREQL